jgi:hypothetical protein
MRRLLLVIAGVVWLTASARAIDLDVRDFCDHTGIRLSAQAKVIVLKQGQTTYSGIVTRRGTVADLGLGETKSGDQVIVTYLGN